VNQQKDDDKPTLSERIVTGIGIARFVCSVLLGLVALAFAFTALQYFFRWMTTDDAGDDLKQAILYSFATLILAGVASAMRPK